MFRPLLKISGGSVDDYATFSSLSDDSLFGSYYSRRIRAVNEADVAGYTSPSMPG